MKNVHFAIPEIYDETLSYYDLLRNIANKTNELVENYNTIPNQIAEEVKNIDASKLFSVVLGYIINSIATDNTKSANAVKLYKKHDLLYATFNESVNLYESLIDFTMGTETELIPETNIREVNISELFIELRELIDNEVQAREQADTALQTKIDNEAQSRDQADTALRNDLTAETKARERANTALQNAINGEKSAREQADATLQRNITEEASAREQADNEKVNKSDVLTLEQIQSTADLTGKIGSAEALKKVMIKERTERNVRTDSTGKYYPGLKTSNIFVLSAKASDYIVDISITGEGDQYYFIVKNVNGNIVANTTIPAIIENYVDR